MSVRSFTATISMSVVPAVCCASTARKKFRPTRPKPFTPTRIVMMSPLKFVVWLAHRLHAILSLTTREAEKQRTRSSFLRPSSQLMIGVSN